MSGQVDLEVREVEARDVAHVRGVMGQEDTGATGNLEELVLRTKVEGLGHERVVGPWRRGITQWPLIQPSGPVGTPAHESATLVNHSLPGRTPCPGSQGDRSGCCHSSPGNHDATHRLPPFT